MPPASVQTFTDQQIADRFADRLHNLEAQLLDHMATSPQVLPPGTPINPGATPDVAWEMRRAQLEADIAATGEQLGKVAKGARETALARYVGEADAS